MRFRHHSESESELKVTQDTWNAYDNLVNAITAICGVGAAVSYTSVTS